MHDVFKTRVRAERVEARAQQNAGVESLFVASLQPVHRLIFITESCIDYGNFGGIRIGRVRALLQISQQVHRFVPLAGRGVGASEIGDACGATSRKLDRFLQFRNGLLVHVFLEVGLPELIMRESKIGIHFDYFEALSYRFVVGVCNEKQAEGLLAW